MLIFNVLSCRKSKQNTIIFTTSSRNRFLKMLFFSQNLFFSMTSSKNGSHFEKKNTTVVFLLWTATRVPIFMATALIFLKILRGGWFSPPGPEEPLKTPVHIGLRKVNNYLMKNNEIHSVRLLFKNMQFILIFFFIRLSAIKIVFMQVSSSKNKHLCISINKYMYA